MAIAAPTTPFVWGQAGAMKTPEQIARDREIAAALMNEGMDYSPVGHWLQGAARAAQGGVGALKERWAGEAETAGREGFQGRWDSVFGGGAAPVQTAALDPVAAALAGTPQTATDATAAMASGAPASDFLSSLIGTESGGNWAAQNNEIGSGGQAGHFGRLQFGQARLEDAKRAGVLPSNITPQQFMASPELQQQVEAWHFADIDQQAANLGLNKYIGQTVGGAPITPEAIRAMAHLGGIGGAQKFLESGGQHNPADAYGTSLLDYALKHGSTGGAAVPTGGGSQSPLQMAQAPDMAALLGLASDPWANDAQRSIVESLMGQQMQQQDPMYQLQMQAAQQGLTKGELEIQQLLNPAAPKPIEVGGVLLDPTTYQPIFDSRAPAAAPKPIEVGGVLLNPTTFEPIFDSRQPEDGQTDTQRNLSWRAEQAGLVQGTPEYAEFMRSGGQSTGMALSVGPDGTVQFAQGGAGMKALTETQSKDAVFATRAAGALPTIDALGNNLTDLRTSVTGQTPVVGNFTKSPEYQQAEQAGTEFLQAILRKDTGAAITPQETEEYGKVYLPRPGDSPQLLEQKRLSRQRALEAIKAGMPPQAILQSEQAIINSGGAGMSAPAQSQAKQITTEEEYNALPSGSVYMDPTGQIRTKR